MKRLLFFIFVVLSFAKEGERPVLSLKELSSIQPGLGTIMTEYGKRFWILYYAAKEGNWELAAYELKEQREIQEVGEVTRPFYASKLKEFENRYLKPIEKSLEKRSFEDFKKAYDVAVKGCNRCHIETGHGFIRYRLPDTPPLMLDLKAK